MDSQDLLEGAYASTGRVVAGLEPEHRHAPTPCAEWDVHALLAHTVAVIAAFERAADGDGASGDDLGAVGEELLAAGPVAVFASASEKTLAAWRRRGVDGTVTLPVGPEVPTPVAAGIASLDCLVHGWDLAEATGQDATLDPALAEAALVISRQVVTPALRPAAFAPVVEVGAEASPTHRLVAFLGRQP